MNKMSSNALENKNVLILGGLGFLGSTLAHHLTRLKANVTVYDALLPGYGGNKFNVHDISHKISVKLKDIRDKESLTNAVKNQDLIFNFAAQVSYIDSLNDPFFDLDINLRSHLQLLEICRHINRGVKVFFASSRFVYGKNKKSVVAETEHPKPLNLYGIHKLACEQYLELYSREFGIPSVALRITNPYGPRQQMIHSKYSIAGWFIRQAMENKVIRIFGDGTQKRDYIFVDDLISAFVAVAQKELEGYHCFNVGTGDGIQFRTMVETIVDIVRKGKIEYVEWPKNYETLETGSFTSDTSKLHGMTGWKPKVTIEEGIEKTFLYYKKYKNYYWK